MLLAFIQAGPSGGLLRSSSESTSGRVLRFQSFAFSGTSSTSPFLQLQNCRKNLKAPLSPCHACPGFEPENADLALAFVLFFFIMIDPSDICLLFRQIDGHCFLKKLSKVAGRSYLRLFWWDVTCFPHSDSIRLEKHCWRKNKITQTSYQNYIKLLKSLYRYMLQKWLTQWF